MPIIQLVFRVQVAGRRVSRNQVKSHCFINYKSHRPETQRTQKGKPTRHRTRNPNPTKPKAGSKLRLIFLEIIASVPAFCESYEGNLKPA